MSTALPVLWRCGGRARSLAPPTTALHVLCAGTDALDRSLVCPHIRRWDNCTKCHYTPGNESSFCEVATRPKLIETQFVDGLRVVGDGTLTLQNSPFWTLTPSYALMEKR